jgi:hypothetical protein
VQEKGPTVSEPKPDGIHPSLLLIDCEGEPSAIDVAMVPLITALWSRGVHTCNGCCQGDASEPAYIAFPDITDADRFSRLAIDGGAPANVVLGVTRSVSEDEAVRAGLWRWAFIARLPFIERGIFRLAFPPDHIVALTAWIEAASPGCLADLPLMAINTSVHKRAGMPANG